MNHANLHIMDTLSLLGELEHQRRHLIKTAVITTDEEKEFKNSVFAQTTTDIRRKLQAEVPEITEGDWCVVKTACTVLQLAYETYEGDIEKLREIENLEMSILSGILKTDLTGCKACKEDMEQDADGSSE